MEITAKKTGLISSHNYSTFENQHIYIVLFSKKIILLFASFQIALTLFAQNLFEFHKVYSGPKQEITANFEEVKDNNLSIPPVSCLYQTKDGIVWAGTEQNGLLCYNGAGFKHYRFDPDNSQSLPSDHIIQLWEEVPGILWITTSNGLAKMDRFTNRITRYSSNAKIVHRGKDNKLYTAENDLCLIDTLTKKIIHLAGQEIFLENGKRYYDEFLMNTNQFSFDKYGTLWASATSKTLSGLFRFDFATNHWIFHQPPIHYQTPGTKNSNPAWLLSGVLFADNKDRIWMGGWNLGLLCYHPKTGLWQEFYLSDEEHTPNQNVITAITVLNEDTLLLSCEHRVLAFNTKTFTAGNYANRKNVSVSPVKWYANILLDDNGNLWFGAEGLFKLNKLNNRFLESKRILNKEPIVSSFYALDPTHFIITSYNTQTNSSALQEVKNDEIINTKTLASFDVVEQIIPAGNDKFYLATTKDLYEFNLGAKFIKRLPMAVTEAKNADKVPHDFFTNILWNDSILYSCHRTTLDAGLMKINVKCRTVKYFKTASKTLSENTPQNNGITKIWLDSYRRIWCSSDAGLDIFYPDKEVFEHYYHIEGDSTSLINSHSPKMMETKDHKFFVATKSGLCETDARPGTKFIFKRVLPLACDWIVEDKVQILWMGNAEGVIKYNPKSKDFTILTAKDGYKWERYYKPFIMPDGKFLMRDGAIINPYTLAENTLKPIPRLVDFFIAGQPAQLDSAIEFKKDIRLRHDQNFFNIVFSCNNLINEQANHYRYFLEGIDDNWVEAGTRNVAYYTALLPGNYHFFVQAANNDGLWGDKKHMLNISIIPIWYQTGWAKLLLAITILIIIFIFYRQRLNEVKAKSIAAEKEAELKQVKAEFDKQIAETEMAALRAQMNPHFIFNVLNSINRFILKNDSEAASEYLSQFALLIRMILENSKSPRISLANDLEALRIYIEMEKLRFLNKFSYQIEVDTGIDQQFTEVPPLLLQPYVENAIWHGLMQKEEPGKLLIRISQVKEDLIKVVIEDDGIGREKSSALKSKTAVAHKSFGLQISKDRIHIVNKIYGLNTQVEVEDLIDENKNACGTRINLMIPV